MPFDYEARLATVAGLLEDHNTTTASPDLSQSLTTRVQNIYQNDPSFTPARGDAYPCVYVWVMNKSERYESLGEPGPSGQLKRATVTYGLLGLHRKEGATAQHSTALTDLYRFAENIEGVFQAKHNLSDTALWVNPAATDFGVISRDGVWIKGVMIELEAEYLFR